MRTHCDPRVCRSKALSTQASAVVVGGANDPGYVTHDAPPADAYSTEEMVQAHGDMDHHNELELAFITVITPLVMKHDGSSLQVVDVSERAKKSNDD
eukprot:CAMPEP_0194379712 /NCGR_PEP_ID=MMETSP0174-20130528/40232_1 /TAXON_ID=216777 /ORGANISM="Proboscia alata, Strain PI-D3" /LENGTH=96 /DNA_ID=CAMNT_0039162575 /DNA_START=298 /DNA_END=585 /DNA_ORIENTATION=+